MPALTARTRDLLIVLATTAIAVALRAGELSPTSLFLDDQWVAYIDRASFGDSAQIGLTSIGFVAGLKVWFTMFGFSETAAQLPSFVAGCLTPALLYLVVRRWISWRFGLFAAGLLTVNELHTTYSYHVKQYTFDALWSVVCLAIAVELMRRGLNVRLTLIAIAGSVFAAAVSFTSVVASSGVFALVAWLIVREVAVGRTSTAPLAQAQRIPKNSILAGVAAVAGGLAIISWYILLVRPNVSEGIRLYWSDHYVDRRGFVTSLRSLANAVRGTRRQHLQSR